MFNKAVLSLTPPAEINVDSKAAVLSLYSLGIDRVKKIACAKSTIEAQSVC